MQKQIASLLLDIGAVSLSPKQPFTWSSGMKSPIYCDNRLTLSYPEVRSVIADGLSSLIGSHYPDAEVIAGTATAGIPHAAFVSERLDLPMVYVRSKAKEHGKGKQIEGLLTEGQKVVIVEDLISTGGSVINAANALSEAGADVLGAVAIFTYELEKGFSQLRNASLDVQTLTDFNTLVEAANENEIITADETKQLKQWCQNRTAML
jgi:orotate phosphoribosyltransferase